MKHSLFQTIARISLIVTISLPGALAIAQEQSPEERFAGNIANARETANILKEEFKRLTDESQEPVQVGSAEANVIGEDLVKAKAAYDEIISAYEQAAAAWTKGDEVEAAKQQAAAQVAMRSKDVWRQRMLEFRRAQFSAAPAQSWYTETAAIVKEAATPAFENLVEKKKAASEAWRDVAEASVPGVTPKAIDDLKEKAFAAMGEVDVALFQFYWQNQLAGMLAQDAAVTKDDLAAPLTKLTEAQDRLVALRREQVEHEKKVRQANADIAKAQEEVNKAFWSTREAKARAAAGEMK